MRVSKTFECSVNLDGPAEELILDGQAMLRTPVKAEFVNEELRIEMDIGVANGSPTCLRYQVERVDGSGLEFMTTEIMRGLPINSFLVWACSVAAWTPSGAGVDSWTHRTRGEVNVGLIEGLQVATRRTRQSITDERLLEFAGAYREHFVRGRMQEFAKSLNYSERQVYRLKKLAQERGLLDEEAAT